MVQTCSTHCVYKKYIGLFWLFNTIQYSPHGTSSKQFTSVRKIVSLCVRERGARESACMAATHPCDGGGRNVAEWSRCWSNLLLLSLQVSLNVILSLHERTWSESCGLWIHVHVKAVKGDLQSLLTWFVLTAWKVRTSVFVSCVCTMYHSITFNFHYVCFALYYYDFVIMIKCVYYRLTLQHYVFDTVMKRLVFLSK